MAYVVSSGGGLPELTGLRRTFGLVALDELSFSVAPGTLFGFVGRNGAGKTTTMRIVCGLLAADSGAVTWRGRPIDARGASAIGYMPEERGLYPKMRARDQLEYFGVLHGLSHAQARAAATAWLERLGLGDRALARSSSSRRATSSGCSSRRRSCIARICSSSTSRSPASIRSSATC